MIPNTTHETIAINRKINASPDQIFSAWADPKAREQWGPPSDDEAIQFLENDFRVGGWDISLCGPKDDLRFRVETVYHHIEAPSRLLFTESVSTDEQLLSASLVTVNLTEIDDRITVLNLTIQIASLVGEEMVAGHQAGWDAAITNLTAYLTG